MGLECWLLGDKKDTAVQAQLEHFYTKIKRMHAKFSYHTLVEKSHPTPQLQKHAASEIILGRLSDHDFLIVLDEKGASFTSVDFSKYLEKWLVINRRIIFCVGGAYGFDDKLKQRANLIWSLSLLTFPHQLARVLLLEQIYRGFSILKNTDYHHE